MQGWKTLIPAAKKIEYLNALLKVGFDRLDFGSFVSAKAIPQMADTHEVIPHLETTSSSTKLLAIIANVRGAHDAVKYDNISYLGFPFSISPTFQKRNANSTIEESLLRVTEIQHICLKHGKKLVVYISMGFGNPYGDEYNEGIVMNWIEKLTSLGIKVISLADTVGIATPQQVSSLLNAVIPAYNNTEITVHLHSSPAQQDEKIKAALDAGCRSFDSALRGIGGCPMAHDDLVGNINTEKMISYFEENNIAPDINKNALQHALSIADSIFH